MGAHKNKHLISDEVACENVLLGSSVFYNKQTEEVPVCVSASCPALRPKFPGNAYLLSQIVSNVLQIQLHLVLA